MCSWQKIKIFKKWKIFSADIIHQCITIHDHMISSFWDIRYNDFIPTKILFWLGWYMTPEIKSVTEKHFYHFGQFCAILLPPNHPKNRNFEKIKKNTWRFHYITLVYQKSWYDLQLMRYGVWQIKLAMLGHFFPFVLSLKTKKIRILRKWKTLLEIPSFHRCVSKITIIWCKNPEIWSNTNIIFCYFGTFFALLPL